MIKDAVVAIMEQHPGVSGMVGGRVYSKKLPQNSPLPAIAFQLIGGGRVRSHSGPSQFADPVFQISCYADNGTVAANLAIQVRLAFECYTGGVAGETIYGAFVDSIWDGYEEETKRHRETVGVRIMHKE